MKQISDDNFTDYRNKHNIVRTEVESDNRAS